MKIGRTKFRGGIDTNYNYAVQLNLGFAASQLQCSLLSGTSETISKKYSQPQFQISPERAKIYRKNAAYLVMPFWRWISLFGNQISEKITK